MKDEKMGRQGPILAGEEPHQVLFDFDRIVMASEAEEA
jgi:hypothetical protein